MLRRRNMVGAAFLAAFGVFGSVAVAGDVVVLDSTVGSIPPGEVLDEAQVVSVPSGGQLTLITADGETRLLSGPFDGPIGSAEQASAVSLSSLASGRGGDTKVLGAVRAPKWEITE